VKVTNSIPRLVQMPANPGAAGTNTNDLRGIKPPVEIPSGWEWLWWTLGALALLTALYFAWRWWWKRATRPPSIPPVPPHIRARQRLQEALQHIADARLFCIAVSDALRVYLEERFELRAPERTTEEFLQDLQRTPHLNELQKRSLADFLERCDLVKFARFEPTEAALRELHESALRLVDETQYEPAPEPTPAPTGGTPPPIASGEAGGSTQEP
jgi:hypothetical protein